MVDRVVENGEIMGSGGVPAVEPPHSIAQASVDDKGRLKLPAEFLEYLEALGCQQGFHHHVRFQLSSNLPDCGVESQRKLVREFGRSGGAGRRRGVTRESFRRRFGDRRAGPRADAGRAARVIWIWNRSRCGSTATTAGSTWSARTIHDERMQPRHGESGREREDAREEGIEVAVMYARAGHVARVPGVPGDPAGRRVSGRDLRDWAGIPEPSRGS